MQIGVAPKAGQCFVYKPDIERGLAAPLMMCEPGGTLHLTDYALDYFIYAYYR
jgi:hypothetical protein